MMWLPVVPGAAALAVLTAMIPMAAAPLFAAAAVALAVSATGRRPWAGTLFCGCVIGLLVVAHQRPAWLVAAVALMLGVHVVLLDAREALPSPHHLREWARGQTRTAVAVTLGVAVPLATALLPILSPTFLVIAGSAAAAWLFWWVAPEDK